MKVLVAGGAGYIGSATVRALLEAGHSVAVFDDLSKGHPQALPKDARLIKGSIHDPAALREAFRAERPEAVMHFAASIEAGESMKRPERYFHNNAAGSFSLLDAVIEAGVRRFVFSSTAAVYGQPEKVPIAEDAALAPTNVYGESKLMVERALAWHHRIHGLAYASLRYFNAAGPGEHHEPETHLIPLVLDAALGKRPSVSIFGTDYPTKDGTCVRDYIHIADLARAHLLALDELGRRSPLVYNLGNGTGFTVREVIETARKVTGRPIPVVEGPRRAGDPAVLVASSEKIRRELGWEPSHPHIEDIVGDAWRWRSAHPDGYR